MVSLLSFFSGKKKARRAPSPPKETVSSSSTPNGVTPNDTSPTRAGRPATRFLSLRHKPTSKPYDLANRRTSSEVSRRRSQKQIPRSQTSELPRLALGWEVPGTGNAGIDSLGLEGVGGTPRLKGDEVEILQKHRYSIGEVTQAWKLFGKALKDNALGASGFLLARRNGKQQQERDYLIALFVLTIRPDLANCFPTIANSYLLESSSSSSSGTSWSERFQTAAGECSDLAALTEALKNITRRLETTSPSSSSPSPVAPLLDIALYTRFAEEERSEGYPIDAYEKLFLPRLQVGVGAYLEEIFEVWSAVCAHAPESNTIGGKISRLSGWWVLGPPSTPVNLDVRELYDEWMVAGLRMQHLFYAWIRDQSIKLQLPIRLVQLIEGYPYGEVQNSPTSTLALPPSSFPRQTLRINLSYSRLPEKPLTPKEVFSSALTAQSGSAEAYPLWKSLIGSRDSTSLRIKDVVDEESLSFLKGRPSHESALPDLGTSDDSLPTPATSVGPMYRPFSFSSGGSTSPTMDRQKSLSHNNLSASYDTAKSPSLQGLRLNIPDTSIGRPAHSGQQTSPGKPRARSTGSETEVWESFEKSGFGEVSDSALALSPKISTPLLSPSTSRPRISFDEISRPKINSTTSNVDGSAIECEEAIEIDNLFMSFVEDAQLDPGRTSDWPSFVLARLKSPLHREDGKHVEWLLITVEYKSPPTPPIEVTHDKRPTSPAMSTVSKSGSSFSLFRRSSSRDGKSGPRRSLFGSANRPLPKTSASSSALPTLSEGGLPASASEEKEIVNPISASSTTPTEYTITEMGEMVKIPAPQLPSAALEPSLDTAPSDWIYRAEGAAHIIFSYRGTSPRYTGQVLRIRKVGKRNETDEEPGRVWRENLLPKLIPSNLLLSSREVKLELEWTETVLQPAEELRPSHRTKNGPILPEVANGEIAASVMEDLIAGGLDKAEKTLCIEIKPKWGFLPRVETIQPDEAIPIKSRISRYRLHHHLRDSEADITLDEYDPLDLYSLDPGRMERALESLWTIWEVNHGLKNNWRVYVDGEIITPSKSQKIPGAAADGTITNHTASLILPVLLRTEVLEKLKTLQSSLDAFDISTLAARFKEAHPDAELFDISLTPEPSAAELNSFVDSYLSMSGDPTSGLKWDLRQSMIAYTLSAIFKDCSVFLRIPLWKHDGVYQLKDGASAKIIDLDLKPMSALRKWYDLDEKIWRHWLSTPPIAPSAAANIETASLNPTLRQGDSSIHTGTGVEAASTRAIFAPTPSISSPSTSIPNTPTQRSINESTLSPTAAIEALSLSDALAISPSKNTFGHGDVESIGEILKDDPEHATLEKAVASNTGESQAHSKDIIDLTVVNSEPDLSPETSDKTHVRTATPDDALQDLERQEDPFTEASEPDVPIRRARSAAPSPSPHPDLSELPAHEAVSSRDIPSALELGVPVPIDYPLVNPLREEGSAGTPATTSTPDFDPADQNPSDSRAVVNTGESTEPYAGEAIETLAEDPTPSKGEVGVTPVQDLDTPVATCGTNTPFEEFSTPVADISEPVLVAPVEAEGALFSDREGEDQSIEEDVKDTIFEQTTLQQALGDATGRQDGYTTSEAEDQEVVAKQDKSGLGLPMTVATFEHDAASPSENDGQVGDYTFGVIPDTDIEQSDAAAKEPFEMEAETLSPPHSLETIDEAAPLAASDPSHDLISEKEQQESAKQEAEPGILEAHGISREQRVVVPHLVPSDTSLASQETVKKVEVESPLVPHSLDTIEEDRVSEAAEKEEELSSSNASSHGLGDVVPALVIYQEEDVTPIAETPVARGLAETGNAPVLGVVDWVVDESAKHDNTSNLSAPFADPETVAPPADAPARLERSEEQVASTVPEEAHTYPVTEAVNDEDTVTPTSPSLPAPGGEMPSTDRENEEHISISVPSSKVEFEDEHPEHPSSSVLAIADNSPTLATVDDSDSAPHDREFETREPRPSESAELLKSYEAERISPDLDVVEKDSDPELHTPTLPQDAPTGEVSPSTLVHDVQPTEDEHRPLEQKGVPGDAHAESGEVGRDDVKHQTTHSQPRLHNSAPADASGNITSNAGRSNLRGETPQEKAPHQQEHASDNESVVSTTAGDTTGSIISSQGDLYESTRSN